VELASCRPSGMCIFEAAARFLEKFVHPCGIICRVLSCFLSLISYLTVNQGVIQSLTPKVLCVGKADVLYINNYILVCISFCFVYCQG
jgi:hypothetical protein